MNYESAGLNEILLESLMISQIFFLFYDLYFFLSILDNFGCFIYIYICMQNLFNVNSMNPEQTDPIVNGSSLIYCLQYRLPFSPKCISRRERRPQLS